MKERVIRSIEADVVFLEVLNQDEKLHISRILLILALYMVLDTNMLMKAYEYHYGEKLRLKFIKKAAKERFIIEYKKNLETQFEENIYFYELKSAGVHELLEAGFYVLVPGRFWTNQERNAILAFNRERIESKTITRLVMSKEDYKLLIKRMRIVIRQHIEGDEFGKYTKAVNPNVIYECR